MSFAVNGRNLGLASKLFLVCEEILIPIHTHAQSRSIFITQTVLPSSCNYSYFNTAHYSTRTFTSLEDPPLFHKFHKFGKYNNFTGIMEKPSDRNSSSSSERKESSNEVQLSNKDKLKRAVKDYGATVIVFHVTMSMMSLGTSYLLISSGVDVSSLLERVGFSSSSDIAAGASTFVVAYAFHKIFAPVRISITLGSTPFIVRYLRKIGFLKPPKSQS